MRPKSKETGEELEHFKSLVLERLLPQITFKNISPKSSYPPYPKPIRGAQRFTHSAKLTIDINT